MPKFKKSLNKILLIFILVVLLCNPQKVLAVNTYSTDEERDSSQYWSKTDHASLDIAADVTVEVWVNFESLATGGGTDIMPIVLKGTAAGGNNTGNYNIEWCPAETCGTKQLRINFRRDADNNYLEYNFDPTLGVWYHIAASRDSVSGDTILYINGSPVQTTPNSAGTDLINNAYPLYIGANENTTPQYFDGLIDEVRIWNDIRTATEIANNYNIELTGTEANLMAYYKLENNGDDSTSGVGCNGACDLTNNNSATFSGNVPFGGGVAEPRETTNLIIFE